MEIKNIITYNTYHIIPSSGCYLTDYQESEPIEIFSSSKEIFVSNFKDAERYREITEEQNAEYVIAQVAKLNEEIFGASSGSTSGITSGSTDTIR